MGHRTVFTVAHDVFDKWFEVEDASEKPDENFNRDVQAALSELKAKDVFTQMAVFERGYGWAIIVVGYSDGGESLEDPVENPKSIDELYAYGPEQISSVQWERDRKSERYGLPETYKIIQSPGHAGRVNVHHTRVIHFATRLLDHPWKGLSVLDPIWDDTTTHRNIRWGMGQTLFRYGSGFPDITLPPPTRKNHTETLLKADNQGTTLARATATENLLKDRFRYT